MINVAEIALPMTPRQARERFDAYMAGWKKHDDEEYRQAAALYKVAAKGKPIIDIATVIPSAGVFPTNLPRLAICRADFPWCHFAWHGTTWTFTGSHKRNRASVNDWDERVRSMVLRVPHNGKARPGGWGHSAVVPMIPPELRPAPSAMREHFILWEAEWQQMPHDPLLLKRIHGSLFYVTGQWDLTPIEQQVLAGRL